MGRQRRAGPRIFASLDSFLAPVPGRTLPGRGMANHQFLLALMRHGSFGGYHFFLSSGEELRAFRSTYGAVAPGGAPITSLPRRDLLRRIETTDYTVFHLADHTRWFQPLCCLRNERAAHPFPVTALTHSVSDPAAMPAYLAMGLAGPRSHDAILCASPSGRQVMQGCFDSLVESTRDRIVPPLSFPMRLPVVPIGVDAAQLASGSRSRGRALAQIPVDRLVMLYSGRFSPHHKMDLFPLLQAFARLRRADGGERLMLLLIGSRQGSPYVDMLRVFAQGLGIADSVSLVADFDEDAKPDLYAAADVFVSPCDNPQETFGLTVVEAMAAGLPVVVSDYDGYRDIVPPEVGIRVPTYVVGGRTGISDLALLVEPASTHLRLGQGLAVDPRALVEALDSLATNPFRREMMGRAGAEHARKRFDWAHVIPQYEALWDDLHAEAIDNGSTADVACGNPLQLDYARVFRHYPTRRLTDDDRLVRTSLGAALLEHGRYPVYAEMTPVLSLDHARIALEHAAEPRRVAALVAVLGEHGVDASRAWRTLLWALKHGLLELGGAAAVSGRSDGSAAGSRG